LDCLLWHFCHLAQGEARAAGEGVGADGLEGADAAEADDAALPGTTEDADEAAEAVSEDELMASDDEEDDVQARSRVAAGDVNWRLVAVGGREA